jgi:hypothetical protein
MNANYDDDDDDDDSDYEEEGNNDEESPENAQDIEKEKGLKGITTFRKRKIDSIWQEMVDEDAIQIKNSRSKLVNVSSTTSGRKIVTPQALHV